MVEVLLDARTRRIHLCPNSGISSVVRARGCMLRVLDKVRAVHLQGHLTNEGDRFLMVPASLTETFVPGHPDALDVIRLVCKSYCHGLSNGLLLVVGDVSAKTVTLPFLVGSRCSWVG